MKHSLFFIVVLFTFLSACKKTPTYPPLNESTSSHRSQELAPFFHGVASGDPQVDRVIIWTRVTPPDQVPEVAVNWEIAKDPGFKTKVSQGVFQTNPDRDYTVKIDVDGLDPGKTYYYRFQALGNLSPVGKTKTTAKKTENVRLGVVSCSNYEWGYFNAYARLAEEKDLDAVLHLGDYIYEYGIGRYGDTTIGRLNIPAHEIVSLQDYRDRYSLYRLDSDLQAVHAAHPFIAIWDDHEITNNSYKDGAENHQAEEGSYETRKARAKQVYYEWMPIRESEKHYRKFSFGELADLLMLDERLAGRTQQADSLTDPRRGQEDMSMLGQEQFTWLANNLTQSSANWKLIGNQVIYSYLDWGYDGFRLNMDGWDGYPVEQEKLATVIRDNALENVMFLTGDTHTSWAIEVTNTPETYTSSNSEGAFATEFGATSVNSANSDERNFTTAQVKLHEAKIVNSELNPHLKYTNMRDHGFLLLHLTPAKASVEFRYVKTLRERSEKMKPSTYFEVISGENKIREKTFE